MDSLKMRKVDHIHLNKELKSTSSPSLQNDQDPASRIQLHTQNMDLPS